MPPMLAQGAVGSNLRNHQSAIQGPPITLAWT